MLLKTKALTLLIAAFGCPLLSSCSLLGTGISDYEAFSNAKIAFKTVDSARLVSQSEQIATIASSPSSSAEAAALKQALAVFAISQLKPDSYGEQAPKTIMDVSTSLVAQVPFVMTAGALLKLGEAGINAAGNVSVGANSTVSDSFVNNENHATGSGTSASLQPREVRPEVVRPEVVRP